MPKLITLQLIAYETHRGKGTTSDPHRIVEAYCLPNGHFVAEYDSHKDESYGTINFFDELRKLSRGDTNPTKPVE